MSRSAPYDRDTALAAAMDVFWEKGFHATSLKDLEAALEMKPGSIYAAFSSKENLYLLALERYFARSRAGFRDQVARAALPLNALADPNRLACRFQANVTALRLAWHQAMGPEDFAQLAEDTALEIEDLRVTA